MDVGARLRAIRKQKNLSQRELAKRAGVTNSTISMIEKNSVSPSVSSLKKVLTGIPISLVEFFAEDVEDEKPQTVVYPPANLLDLSVNDIKMKLVGKSFGHRALAFMVETYEPGADTGEDMYVHEGEEAGMVLKGQLELTVSGEIYHLKEGDSYYFDSTRPHRFRNPYDKPCEIVSATTPANF
ncbi:XRE family transcriptional regulator [Hahella sp. CCB-MM4]|uniref:cupin domain-containing protein n=1 Tax=Hahella sp. (strain CCB-MM4) TaxID=1926491 RepID=UPI000B9C2FA3|nr:cupin domain-containing protein [Hahella sp. CCB-MM4]OZG74448.1 XRE family transcriptional regulator [Hahella sp. CCB-MM4]